MTEIKITDAEYAKAAECDAIIEGFDTKKAMLVAASILIKLDTEDTIDMICDTLEAISVVYSGSAQSMMDDVLKREGMTVDVATDLIAEVMEKAVLVDEMAKLLRRAAEPNQHGEHGLFTPDWDHINRCKESLRAELTRKKNLADLAAKRAAQRR